jgi:hypothetical protein
MSIAEAPDGLLALPTITDCRWRLDVTVSTSALSRSFQPSVLMSLTFSDGQVRTFAVSVAQLHQLRYLLARSLRDLSLLEAKREKKK